jgi:hypothetical protein
VHKNARTVLSRPGCLAESNGVGGEGMRMHPNLPEGRNLRTHFADASSGCVGPSNIAEGHARISTGEFRQFLGHVHGSLVEIETQILIGERLSNVDAEKSNELLRRTTDLGKILNGLLRSGPTQR